MGCITNVIFGVLINRETSLCFHSQIGLRQGFPLSPLLFLLATKGLSQMILSAKHRGDVKGIEEATNIFVTYLLFVDDILLFSDGSKGDLQQLKVSLDLFLKATSMCINEQKSSSS